jgi:hypothetical protein
MSLRTKNHAATLVASLLFMLLATGHTSATVPPPPNPVLVFSGVEYYQASGKQWVRYKFRVDNLADYPNELFAAAPELPPCGTNTKAARTWVDIYDQGGRRLYGFCAIGDHDGLAQLWFNLESDVVPPSWVYIELTDRKTNTKYKSNLSDTVM